MADEKPTVASVLGSGQQGGSKPKPGARKTQLQDGLVIPFIANSDGEWEVDTSRRPTEYITKPPAARNSQIVYVDGGDGREYGYLVGPDGKTEPFMVGGKHASQPLTNARQPREPANLQLSGSGGSRSVFDPETGSITSAPDQYGLQRQAYLDDVSRTGQLIALNQDRRAEIEADFNRRWKLGVTLPNEIAQEGRAVATDKRAARTAQSNEASTAGKYAFDRYKAVSDAGTDEAKFALDVAKSKAPPGFANRYLRNFNRIQGAITGGTATPYTEDSFMSVMPDLYAARDRGRSEAGAAFPGSFGELMAQTPQYPTAQFGGDVLSDPGFMDAVNRRAAELIGGGQRTYGDVMR